MKDVVRLNFDFPREHYPYLKMMCAKKSKSIREIASDLLIKEIESYEDEQLVKIAEIRLKDMKEEDLIPFYHASELAGWDNPKSGSDNAT